MTKSHLVKDSEMVRRHWRQFKREEEAARVKEWIKEQNKDSILMDDDELDPTNIEAKLGSPMTAEELERKLLKINPNWRFINHPYNPTLKVMYFSSKDHQEDHICYHPFTMAERSVMSVKEEWILDPTQTHIDRLNFPDGLPDENGVFPDGTKPGFIKVRKPGREISRGWRTVLLRLVASGAANLSAIEKEFKSDNTRQWAAHTGRQNLRVTF